MKHIASAIVFLGCLGWIAASILLHGPAASHMGGWDWLAAIGAFISFFGAVD